MTWDARVARGVFPFFELASFPGVGVLVGKHLGVAVGGRGEVDVSYCGMSRSACRERQTVLEEGGGGRGGGGRGE